MRVSPAGQDPINPEVDWLSGMGSAPDLRQGRLLGWGMLFPLQVWAPQHPPL